ncbi:MAG TPA: hypothetical protein PK293_13705 [Spirochaetota bacterium]|nr:hypothetical protein [Spirochaetota bacterium]
MEKNFNISDWTLRDLARPLFRQKSVIIIIIIMIISGTYIGLQMKTPEYEASVKMLIKGQSQTVGLTYEGIGAYRIHLTQMEIVKSEPVLKRVVMTLKLDERSADYEKNYASTLKKPFIDFYAKSVAGELNKLDPEKRKEVQLQLAVQRLKENIKTELVRNTDIFYIVVKDYDPQKVIEIANVLSRAYTIFDQQQQLAELALRYGELHPTVMQLRDNIFTMDQSLSGARLPDLEAIGTASVKIIEQATSDGYPIGKPRVMIFFTALLGSFFVAFALALLFDFADKTFHGPEDITRLLQLPLIGFIAHKTVKEKINIKNANRRTEYTESFNKIIEQMTYIIKTKTIKSLLISFFDDNKNNNYLVLNICYMLSLNYPGILIVDCSRKNKDIKSIIENEYSESASVENNNKITNRINNNLTYISLQLDNNNPLQELQSSEFEAFTADLKQNYELIIYICSNSIDYRDAIIVSKLTDGIIPVINEGIHKKQLVINSIASFKEENINIAGVILNDRHFPIPDIIYKKI